jgi:hypothetical protein
VRKARKVAGGFVVKRTARVEHECYDCGGCIEPNEQYYQLSLEHYHRGYYTKCICEQCWRGKELVA